jgi:protein-tyrosine phosphatase
VTDPSPGALSGAYNFRDLGGLPTADGRRVRRGRFFRSDTLQVLAEDDVAHLVDGLGVAAVVDLRSPAEAVEEGRGPIALHPRSVTYVNVPLGMARLEGWDRDAAPGVVTAQMYLEQITADPGVPLALELISVLAARPTVVHCTIGKDRTGVVVAMALLALGVDEETVVADYMASAANIDRMVERLRGWPRYAAHMGVIPDEFYRVEEAAVRRTLAGLRERYGDPAGWAAERLAPGVVERLRAHLLEPARPSRSSSRPKENRSDPPPEVSSSTYATVCGKCSAGRLDRYARSSPPCRGTGPAGVASAASPQT